MNISGYDAWRLRGPEERHEVGTEPGDTCGRYAEPDEDAPRNYRPRPCGGEMKDDDGYVVCNLCGEMG
jgi:hypothetical protein